MAHIGSDLKKLSPRQERAIQALLATTNISEAAATAGVGRRSLHRWLADPDFLQALQEARRQAFRRTVEKLGSLAGLAVDVLREILRDDAKAASEIAPIRVRAAKAALDSMLRAHGLIEIEERLRAAEQKLEALEHERQISTWKN